MGKCSRNRTVERGLSRKRAVVYKRENKQWLKCLHRNMTSDRDKEIVWTGKWSGNRAVGRVKQTTRRDTQTWKQKQWLNSLVTYRNVKISWDREIVWMGKYCRNRAVGRVKQTTRRDIQTWQTETMTETYIFPSLGQESKGVSND